MDQSKAKNWLIYLCSFHISSWWPWVINKQNRQYDFDPFFIRFLELPQSSHVHFLKFCSRDLGEVISYKIPDWVKFRNNEKKIDGLKKVFPKLVMWWKYNIISDVKRIYVYFKREMGFIDMHMMYKKMWFFSPKIHWIHIWWNICELSSYMSTTTNHMPQTHRLNSNNPLAKITEIWK